MIRFAIATCIAAFAMLLNASANVARAAGPTTQTGKYDCFTDDGYGRKRPCAQGYQQKRADQNPYECFTDDGHGRRRACTDRLKR
jgi:hypothetical protein